MSPARSNAYSYLAAGILAAVTLVTFYFLRNYGPESAVSIFTRGAVQGDWRTVASVSYEPVQHPAIQRLVAIVSRLRGTQVQVQNKTSNGPEVMIWVAYLTPEGEIDIYWIVDRTPSGWLVNAEKTVVGGRQYD